MADTNTESTVSRPVQVKLVLLGEAAVGKSSVVLRFVSNDFQENKEPTIGAAFLTQKCRLEDKVIKFEIWDTAGQERFHSAPMYYRNAAAAVVVYDVTSATSLEKAKSWVKELQRQANPNIVIAFIGNKLDLVQGDSSSSNTNGDDSSTTIVPSTDSEAGGQGSSSASSSSSDDEDEEADDATATPAAAEHQGGGKNRQVPKEEAAAYAQEAGLLFFETSAKTGEGIVDVFTELAKKIPLEQYQGSGGRGGGSRTAGAGGAGGRNAAGQGNNSNSNRVNLDDQSPQAGQKDGCAC